jgi:hypothetical protein
MAKSQALARAEALAFNQADEIRQLKDQMAQLVLTIAAQQAAPAAPAAPVASDVVSMKAEPTHLRCISDIYFSVTRPLMAAFVDRDAAFAYRKELAGATPGRIVRVETVLGVDRETILDLVY